jgi:hypothetical protein
MKKKYGLALICGILLFCWTGLYAQEEGHESGEAAEAHEVFVHPFLAHMGLPDAVSEVSIRLTGFRQRLEGLARSDYAVHIEAGLGKNFGLHIRSDGIQIQDRSEVMLQYAVLGGKGMRNGLAIIGEIEIPTGNTEDNNLKALVGVSSRLTYGKVMVFDATLHFDPKETALGYESSFVFRANEKFFPMVEVRGHIHDEIEAYVLTGIKFRIADHSSVGVGVQSGLSSHREYDNQALLTYSASF